MTLFLEAVDHLETKCKLKMIASISDKSSPKPAFMHSENNDICYKAINIFAPDRHILFSRMSFILSRLLETTFPIQVQESKQIAYGATVLKLLGVTMLLCIKLT